MTLRIGLQVGILQLGKGKEDAWAGYNKRKTANIEIREVVIWAKHSARANSNTVRSPGPGIVLRGVRRLCGSYVCVCVGFMCV